jgi:hypothetical protein
MRLVREGGKWHDHRGEALTSARMASFRKRPSQRWLLQALVRGHPALGRLSDTDGLQTVRVVTVADAAGVTRIVAARLRLICGGTAHDNFDYGRTGNLIAILDIHEGTIRSVVGGRGRPSVIRQVTHHPRTGRALIGYHVPAWPAIEALAHEAAKAFLPLRTIGWDVAVTGDRPCLIEGNVTWDTLSGDPRMGEILRSLRDEAAG